MSGGGKALQSWNLSSLAPFCIILRYVVCSVEKSGTIYLLSVAGMLFCAGRAILLCFAAMRFTTLPHMCVHCPLSTLSSYIAVFFQTVHMY